MICLFLLFFLLPWETDLRKHCYDLCQRMFCLKLSTGSFMVSCFVFKSLSHFEFIFVYGVRVCSKFIDLYVAVQLSQHHLLKRLSFLLLLNIFLPPLSKIDYRCGGNLSLLIGEFNPYLFQVIADKEWLLPFCCLFLICWCPFSPHFLHYN